MQKLQLACIFLASGLSRRFGDNKLLADFNGETLSQRVLNNHAAQLFVQNIVVTKYPPVALCAAMRGFTVCENNSECNDISNTIHLGLNALEKDTDGCMFTVCDLPFFSQQSCQSLVDTFYKSPTNIITASYDGESKNPCIFPKHLYPQLLSLTGNHGGRYVIQQNTHLLINVELPKHQLVDIDTKDDLINALS